MLCCPLYLILDSYELCRWFLTGKDWVASLLLQGKRGQTWLKMVKHGQTWFGVLEQFFYRHSPHDEDGEADKDEKGATDSDHGKCPEVDLAIP